MSLMCNFELDFKAIEAKYKIDFKADFKNSLDKLKPFEDENLIQIVNDKITVSDTGRLLIRNIAMVFDAYMFKHEGAQNRFSKTI